MKHQRLVSRKPLVAQSTTQVKIDFLVQTVTQGFTIGDTFLTMITDMSTAGLGMITALTGFFDGAIQLFDNLTESTTGFKSDLGQ